ncbi:hypothetical protein [Deinococcus sonorensis]|uniref:DinB-like domain-containing protein n=2 Tax=Deinococcus sonorensis TaxID=309891 RepID=A0AAU7UA63_9DEIO
MTGEDLALLLDESARDDEASLGAALHRAEGQVPPRVAWLVTHLSVVKREYWTALHAVLDTPLPAPELNLSALCEWEGRTVRTLSAAQLEQTLSHAGRTLTVAALLRLNARHTVWHAGQIAALSNGPRWA